MHVCMYVRAPQNLAAGCPHPPRIAGIPTQSQSEDFPRRDPTLYAAQESEIGVDLVLHALEGARV